MKQSDIIDAYNHKMMVPVSFGDTINTSQMIKAHNQRERERERLRD